MASKYKAKPKAEADVEIVSQPYKEVKEVKATITAAPASKYSVAELMQAAQTRFGTMPECVYAALTAKGIKEATIEEAGNIVKEFLERKV